MFVSNIYIFFSSLIRSEFTIPVLGTMKQNLTKSNNSCITVTLEKHFSVNCLNSLSVPMMLSKIKSKRKKKETKKTKQLSRML